MEINGKRSYNSINTHRLAESKSINQLTSIYASKNVDTVYTTDEGCQLVGEFDKPLPEGGWSDVVDFTHDVYFGRTDISVCSLDKTSQREFEHKFRLPYDI